MSDYMTRYNAANLLESLERQGLPTEGLADFILRRQQERELPLYLRALVGVGAFLASVFFIGSLTAAGIIDFHHAAGAVTWGLVFIAAAIGLQRVAGNGNTVKHSFCIQSSFACMAIGKVSFVGGISQIIDSGWGVTLALLIVTAITYHIYRMSIDRFLSAFAVLFSVLVNIVWDWHRGDAQGLLLNVFFLGQFAGAAVLLTHGRIKRDYIPLSYAFTFSLCANVLFFAMQEKFSIGGPQEMISPAFVNLVLACGLVALFGWTAGGMEKLKCAPLVLASIGAVLLGFISAPGILLTIGLMVLGYAKHEKLLIIAGALLMPLFIYLYYSNLDISLMQKSGVLVGSGAVLLAGRLYLTHKGWDAEGGDGCVQK